MSEKNPTKVVGPPGRPILPPQAEAEILSRLFTNMKISSGEIAVILENTASAVMCPLCRPAIASAWVSV